jgi:peroxiredoxin-like protein
MSEDHSYRVAAWWTSGRTGLAKSDSAPNAIHFTAPTEFGGLEGRWTPEELLLAAVASCYTTTLRAIAGSALFDFTDLQVEASGTVRKADSGYSFAQIVVRPNLKIASAEERDRALELLKRAEKLCLVSRALGTNLKFEPQLEIVKAPSMNASDGGTLELQQRCDRRRVFHRSKPKSHFLEDHLRGEVVPQYFTRKPLEFLRSCYPRRTGQ